MSDNFFARPSGWQIASRAWRSLFQAMGRMPVLFASAFVLFLLLQVFALAMVNRTAMQGLPFWSLYVGMLAQNIISALVTAPVAVAVHRWVLLNDTQPALSWKPPYTRLFFFWALALHLVYLLMTLPTIPLVNEAVRTGITGQHPRPGVILLNMVPVLIMIVLSAYLAPIFPDVAIGEPSASWTARIKVSAGRVRGNFWLLVRAAILAFLPVIVIQIILSLVTTRISGRLVFTMDLLSPASAARVLVGGADMVLSVGLAAATVSWLYSWARSQKAEVRGG